MKLNEVLVVDRFNRPGTLQRVFLRADFLVNGSYTDPYQVSSVSIFKSADNISPNSVLDSSSGLISSGSADDVKFRFVGVKDSSAYAGLVSDASSIYKIDDGRYGVVLDGVTSPSSTNRDGDIIANQATAAGRYIDVWTVKMTESSDWQTFIHEFELFQDAIVSITEPLLISPKHKLHPKIVELGEVVDLKVFSEITIQNKSIDSAIRNHMTQAFIQDAMVEIVKINEDSNLPSRVTVKSFSDTSADIRTTSDNTLVYSFNTSSLTQSPGIEGLGSGTGTYKVKVKYNAFNETLISPDMYFTVR